MENAHEHDRPSRARRAVRGGPFLAVALCFLLPFFSASSCGSGRETTATGADIVLGTTLIAQQTSQPLFATGVQLGPAGPDPEAQRVSRAARPWAITALVIALVGAGLAGGLPRHRRGASATATVAALVALYQIGATFHAPDQDISAAEGLFLAWAILLGNGLWQFAALAYAGIRACNPGADSRIGDDPVEEPTILTA